MKKYEIKGYYLITDAELSLAGNESDIRNAIAARVNIVQYRNKNDSVSSMLAEASKLKKICSDILFIINDRVDIVLALDADGVHLGQSDLSYGSARKLLPNKIIGVTVHNLEEALQATKAGADYLGVSPIFSTDTKKDAGRPCGTGLIKEIKKNCKIPIIAIGGINLTNAPEVITVGADGLCAISAVVTKTNPKKEILKFQELFECKYQK